MICPYCKESFEPRSGISCKTCRTALHAECSELNGGRCVTFGCRSTSFEPSRPDERRRLDPAMPLSLTLRRGALAALAIALPPLEDAALAALAGAGVAAMAWIL